MDFLFLRSAAECPWLPSSQQDPWGSRVGVWQLMSSGSSQLFLLDLQTHSGGWVFHAVTYSKLLSSAFFQTVTHRMFPFSWRLLGTGCLINIYRFGFASQGNEDLLFNTCHLFFSTHVTLWPFQSQGQLKWCKLPQGHKDFQEFSDYHVCFPALQHFF